MTETPGNTSASPSAAPRACPGLDEAQLGLVVGGLQPRVGAQRGLPFVRLGDDPGARERRVAVGRQAGPPAWSKCRWLSATASTVSGSKPASRRAGRMGSPAHAPLGAVVVVHPLADARLHQHPPGGRLDEQAVERLGQGVVGVDLVGRPAAPTSSAARDRRSFPRRIVNVPAWTSATRTPPPRSVRQSTFAVMPSEQGAGLAGCLGPPFCDAPAGVEVAVRGRRGRCRLALVLGAQLLAAVRPFDRAGHGEEADLADLHAEVERDGQVGDVGQLERQGALPARVDIARRGWPSRTPSRRRSSGRGRRPRPRPGPDSPMNRSAPSSTSAGPPCAALRVRVLGVPALQRVHLVPVVAPDVDRALAVAADDRRRRRPEQHPRDRDARRAEADHRDAQVLEPLVDHLQALNSAASTTTAVPCWSSWKTGMSSSSASRSSISKQRGEEMSSRLMPPKPGAIALTVSTISSGSFVSRQIGKRVDAAELLEQHRLALHDRHRGLGADVAEAEHRGAVGDDGHGVRA